MTPKKVTPMGRKEKKKVPSAEEQLRQLAEEHGIAPG